MAGDSLKDIEGFLDEVSDLPELPADKSDLKKLDALRREVTGKPPTVEPMLSESEREVDDLIRAEGPLTARQICRRLVQLCRVATTSEKYVYNRVIPALKKKRGLKNQRGRGYYYTE